MVRQTGQQCQSHNLPTGSMDDGSAGIDFRYTLKNHYHQKAISWFTDDKNQAILQEAFPSYPNHDVAASLYHYIRLRDKLFHQTAELTMMINALANKVMDTPEFEDLNKMMMNKTKREKGMLESNPLLPSMKKKEGTAKNPIVLTDEPLPIPNQFPTPYPHAQPYLPPPTEPSTPSPRPSPIHAYTKIVDETARRTILGVPYNFCTCLSHDTTHLNKEKRKEKKAHRTKKKKNDISQPATRNNREKSMSNGSSSSNHSAHYN